MFAYSFMFGAVIRGLSNGGPGDVCPVTYADNWEVWCSRLGYLIELLDPLAAFLRTCRLPISVDKCWGWCLGPVGRKRLKQCQFDDQTLPVVLSAKCLGAEIAYSYRIAATTRNKRVRGLDSSGWPDCHWGSTVVSPSSERVSGNKLCTERLRLGHRPLSFESFALSCAVV